MNTVEYLHPGQWPVSIGFTTSPEAFDAEMKRLDVQNPWPFKAEGAAAAMHGFKGQDGDRFIICCEKPSRHIPKHVYAALVAHEALHVVQEMERLLFPSGRFDDESAAYLLHYIVEHCLQCIWPSKLERSIK